MADLAAGSTRRMLLRPLVCALAIGCVGLSGCGSGGDPASGGPSGAPDGPNAATACDLVTPADLAAVTGDPSGDGDQMLGDEADITGCRYPEVLVRFSPHLGSQNAGLNRPAGAREVPGLGDGAYTYPDTSAGPAQNVLSVVIGSAQLYLVSMDLTVDQLVALARRGLDRL